MDVREKLVELLTDNLPRCGNLPRWDNPLQLSCDEQVQRIADHLIMNGVTIQEWISVEDRLPEDSANVLVCHKNGLVTTNAWLGANWWFKNERNPITHWMPLPQPPKGE